MFTKLTHAKYPCVNVERINQMKKNAKYKSLSATEKARTELSMVRFIEASIKGKAEKIRSRPFVRFRVC